MAQSSYHNCATKPERLTASAQRMLPPALLPLTARVRTRSLSNQAARTRGASARTCCACTRARPCRLKPRSRAPPPDGPRAASRALSARFISAAAARARLLVLARRRHSLEKRPRGGGCCGGFEAGGGGGAAKEKAAVRAPSDPPAAVARASAGPTRSRLWAQEAGETQAQLTQRRGVRSGRHGAPGDRHQRFLVLGGGFSFANLPGGREPDYAAEEHGEPVLSRGGRRRRQTHKEGGERMQRGWAGGGGTGAWIGPARGELGVSGLRLVER